MRTVETLVGLRIYKHSLLRVHNARSFSKGSDKIPMPSGYKYLPARLNTVNSEIFARILFSWKSNPREMAKSLCRLLI